MDQQYSYEDPDIEAQLAQCFASLTLEEKQCIWSHLSLAYKVSNFRFLFNESRHGGWNNNSWTKAISLKEN